MGAPTRHHRVPVFYQRSWSVNARVMLHDKSSGKPICTTPRDSMVAKRIFSYRDSDGSWNHELEHHFARIENQAAPHVQRFIGGADDDRAQLGVKALIASCFARGQAVADRSHQLAAEHFPSTMQELAAEQTTLELFEREFGRTPERDELLELILSVWTAQIDRNNLFVDSVTRAHNYAVERLMASQLQRVHAPPHRRIGLLSCDTPLSHASAEHGLHVGVAEGLALGDAGFAFFPLSPRLGVCVTETPRPEVHATVALVQWINRTFTFRSAARWLLASPHMDIDRCLATTSPTPEQ